MPFIHFTVVMFCVYCIVAVFYYIVTVYMKVTIL
jgi:hypothetical protein